MDGLFSRIKLCPSCCYLTFFHIPERSIALVNDWLVHQKELKLIPTCPTLTKVLLQGSTRILIYMDGFFQSHQTVPKPLLSYLLPYSQRSIALVKRLAGSPKGAEIDPNLPHANKSVTQVAHAFLYTWMDFFQSHQTVPKLLSYLLPYSRTFNCTSKTTGWFTKRS
jgi:hypothetical protein